MQVLKFPDQPQQPTHRIHPITMSDRLRDMRIVHNLPAGDDFTDTIEHFHESLDDNNPLVPLLDLSFRYYLRHDTYTHREKIKYQLGVVVARIVVNTQLVEQYNTSIDSPDIIKSSFDERNLRPFLLQRFALRSFYESDEHPEQIKAAIRHEVGHIISPEPETRNDWFAIGLGDGHAVLSHVIGEDIDFHTEPLYSE